MKGRAMGLSAASLVLVGSLMLLSLVATSTEALNVTQDVSAYPDYSQMTALLSSTGVNGEIDSRNSLTLLVVTNAVLSAFISANPNVDQAQLGDLLRYHCLLQYLDIPELDKISVGNPTTVTTLYQTTGRAPMNSGSVNIYNNGTNILVGQANVATTPTTMIVTNLTQRPYNVSYLEVDSVLVPPGFGAAPTTANLTAILEAGKTYNTFLNLLQSTGTDSVFFTRENGAGICIFAPDDASFSLLPPGSLNSLTPAQAKTTLEYHALTAYYTLGALTGLDNEMTPTVATLNTSPGQYLLSITSLANAPFINSGVSNTTIASTLYDSPPTVVFGVSSVLLPEVIFAAAPAPAPALVPALAPSPTNASVPVPAPGPLSLTPALSPTPVPAPLSTPTPAPSPLSPSPTPAPTPVSAVPAPVPVALSPGPPAPPTSPTGSIPGEVPAAAPGGSSSHSDATSTTINVAVLTAVALISTVALL
ncbi:unnamed protein product [Calypogeia fissa]